MKNIILAICLVAITSMASATIPANLACTAVSATSGDIVTITNTGTTDTTSYDFEWFVSMNTGTHEAPVWGSEIRQNMRKADGSTPSYTSATQYQFRAPVVSACTEYKVTFGVKAKDTALAEYCDAWECWIVNICPPECSGYVTIAGCDFCVDEPTTAQGTGTYSVINDLANTNVYTYQWKIRSADSAAGLTGTFTNLVDATGVVSGSTTPVLTINYNEYTTANKMYYDLQVTITDKVSGASITLGPCPCEEVYTPARSYVTVYTRPTITASAVVT